MITFEIARRLFTHLEMLGVSEFIQQACVMEQRRSSHNKLPPLYAQLIFDFDPVYSSQGSIISLGHIKMNGLSVTADPEMLILVDPGKAHARPLACLKGQVPVYDTIAKFGYSDAFMDSLIGQQDEDEMIVYLDLWLTLLIGLGYTF